MRRIGSLSEPVVECWSQDVKPVNLKYFNTLDSLNAINLQDRPARDSAVHNTNGFLQKSAIRA